jgi:cytochrome c biogenesis protein CcdA
MAAVAVFAASVGGFLTALMAFLIFAVTMGLLIFFMSFLGATSGPALAIPLRLWGRRIQKVSGVIIILVGGALIYASANPGLFARLLLST